MNLNERFWPQGRCVECRKTAPEHHANCPVGRIIGADYAEPTKTVWQLVAPDDTYTFLTEAAFNEAYPDAHPENFVTVISEVSIADYTRMEEWQREELARD